MLAHAPVPIHHCWTVNFPEHLAALRKQKGMTQQQLADRVGVHVVQEVLDSMILQQEARSWSSER